MKDEFITVREAAEILKTNPRHIKNLIKAGKMRGKNIAVGNERHIWRVLKSDVLKTQDGTVQK